MKDLTPCERLQALKVLERRHDLFGYRVDGWSAWRVMRNPIHGLARALPLSEPAQSNARRSVRALVASFRLARLMLSTDDSRELLLKTCRSGLRFPLGSQFRDVYFDGLLQRGHSFLKIEEINSPDFEVQAAAACWPAAIDPVVFTFWGRVLGLLFPVDAASFCEFVAGLLGREAQIEVKSRWLLMLVSTVYWQSRMYSMLLARLRPKAVLVSDTGEYALRIASHRRGVRFIELQHGVFDSRHPDAIPGWVQGDSLELVLPDILACRGEYWVEQLSTTRQGQGHAVAVGNELIDIARERRRSRDAGGVFHVVLTTQGLDSERLATWIGEMISAAPGTLRWRLSIKLHPVYDAETRAYEALRSDNRIRMIGGADQPNVFDLLADADLHLSIASACHFDAAALGVPTFVVPLSGHEIMLHAVDGMQILVAEKPSSVWSFVVPYAADTARARRFALPGFVDNLQRLLD